MPKLKPCPFCGSEDIDPDGWSSETHSGPCCNRCSATAGSVVEWNTRAEHPEDDGEPVRGSSRGRTGLRFGDGTYLSVLYRESVSTR